MTGQPGLNALRAEKLDRILEVARDLARPADMESLLYRAVDAAKDLLDAEGGTVWRYLAATNELETAAARGLSAIRIPAGVGIVGECLRTGALINVPDCYADPRFDRSMDRRSGYRTRCLLTLPLVGYDDFLVGVLQVVNRRSGVFDAEDESLASVLAGLCAVALQRAQLTQRLLESEKLSQEIAVAREVQMSTLPKAPPEVPGYDLAGAFRPADETGGDTYDFVPTADGGVMVLMGDATGHGIGPALSATEVRAMLRIAQRLGAGLDDTFRHINDQLLADLPDDRFVTAFLGHLDPSAHTLRYHSGGQGPLLHLRAAEGSCISHMPTTAPLGAMPQTSLRSPHVIHLEAGDLFALLSDGVFEYHDGAGREFGEAAVADLLRRHQDKPMTEVRDLLLHALAEFGRGTPQLDDISIVLIRRLPAARQAATATRDFARALGALDEVFEFLGGTLSARGIGSGDRYAISLAIEELFTNMVRHNPAGSGRIGLEVTCGNKGVTCRLTDPDSERFDITAAPDADVSSPAERRVPGGLGIHIVRRLVDSIDYDYSGRRSRITFHRALSGTSSVEAVARRSRTSDGPSRQATSGMLPEGGGGDAMFEIGYGPEGTIAFSGRLDAAQCAKAEQFVSAANGARIFDFSALEYISSAGLGVLLKAHKRLLASGGRLRLVNVNSHIYDIFRFSGFDQVFDVERAGS